MKLFLLFFTTVFASVHEPADGQLIFGPWYDRLNGETPVNLNNLLGFNCSLFHSDINITTTGIQSDAADQIAQQIIDTKTDAYMYLSVFSYYSVPELPDSSWNALVDKIVQIRKTGIRMFVRILPEMNGNWFAYGQNPKTFKSAFQNVVTKIKAQTDGVAIIWAPNSANGYPFPGGKYMAKNGTEAFQIMDTNKNGQLDINDDPYTPFYPGDEYVDWVGFSIYHYGAQWPWETNDVPVPGKAEAILIGTWPDSGPFDLYTMFSSDSIHKKPFVITETAATVHLMKGGQPIPLTPELHLKIKQTWWRQLFNSTFIQTYPRVKMINIFEFLKFEETTWRDFRVIQKQAGLLDAFKADISPLRWVLHANYSPNLQNMNNHEPSNALRNSERWNLWAVAFSVGFIALTRVLF